MNSRSNPNSNSGSFLLKRTAFLGVVCVLIAAIVLLSAKSLLANSSVGSDKSSGTAGGAVTSTEDGKLIINDLYSGQRTIPNFKIDLNTYDADKFLNDQGVIRYDSEDALLGIDVSSHQGEIDWPTVKASGIDFVMIRAGNRGATRGRLYEDSYFKQNYEGATAAGLKVGVYFFSQAITASEAEEEASYVLQLLMDKKVTYPVVFDWEPLDGLRTAGVNGEQMTTFANTFCRKIKQAGYTPAVYFNLSQAYGAYDLEKLKDYDFWLAEYQPVPSFWYDFEIWQYSDNAQVLGINTAVDIDISFKKYG